MCGVITTDVSITTEALSSHAAQLTQTMMSASCRFVNGINQKFIQFSTTTGMRRKVKRIVSKEIRPIFSTTVDPSEYDIDAQMERMVKLANKDAACFVDMDVGKVWGLYQAWKRLVNAGNQGQLPRKGTDE